MSAVRQEVCLVSAWTQHALHLTAVIQQSTKTSVVPHAMVSSLYL